MTKILVIIPEHVIANADIGTEREVMAEYIEELWDLYPQYKGSIPQPLMFSNDGNFESDLVKGNLASRLIPVDAVIDTDCTLLTMSVSNLKPMVSTLYFSDVLVTLTTPDDIEDCVTPLHDDEELEDFELEELSLVELTDTMVYVNMTKEQAKEIFSKLELLYGIPNPPSGLFDDLVIGIGIACGEIDPEEEAE